MIHRHVERFEVVVIVLELGPLDDQEAEAQEDGLDALAQQRERMPVADERRTAGQRDVDGVGPALALLRRARELREARLDDLFDVLLQLVGRLAEARTLVGAGAPERLHEGGDQAVLARQIPVAHAAQIGVARRGRHVGVELLPERSNVHAIQAVSTRKGQEVKRSGLLLVP
jgi:hypothetical protein